MSKPEPIAVCDQLREPETACRPDERSARFVVVNPETGESRPSSLADAHARLVDLVIHDVVPAEVRVHFETARNLLLFSWFCYRFMQVAELHALGTVEMALRRKIGVRDGAVDAPGLAFMLKHALAESWIRNEGFRHVERLKTTPPEPVRQVWVDHEGVHVGDIVVQEAPDVSGYPEMLATRLPEHRNRLAHGSELLYSPHLILELCCDIINQLFQPAQAEQTLKRSRRAAQRRPDPGG